MNLHQLNLGFDAAQDRLLLRVSTTDVQEFRFWLTRRLVARLWPRLVDTLKADLAVSQADGSSKARPEWLEFRHAAAIQQSDLITPYSSAAKTPALGPEPLLATKLSLQPLDANRYELILTAATGTCVNLVLATAVLHGLLKLLQDAVQGTDWALGLQLPAAAAVSLRLH